MLHVCDVSRKCAVAFHSLWNATWSAACHVTRIVTPTPRSAHCHCQDMPLRRNATCSAARDDTWHVPSHLMSHPAHCHCWTWRTHVAMRRRCCLVQWNAWWSAAWEVGWRQLRPWRPPLPMASTHGVCMSFCGDSTCLWSWQCRGEPRPPSIWLS